MRPVKSLSIGLPLGGSLIPAHLPVSPSKARVQANPIFYAGLGLAEEALYLGNFRLTENRKHIRPG